MRYMRTMEQAENGNGKHSVCLLQTEMEYGSLFPCRQTIKGKR